MASFSIGELAAEFDITPRSIRFYEDQGILAPGRSGPAGRHRVYSQRDRIRLRMTLRAKRLGLSLAQIRELVDMYETPSDSRMQLERFIDVLSKHHQSLARQREDLDFTLAEIESHMARARALLQRYDDQARASEGRENPDN